MIYVHIIDKLLRPLLLTNGMSLFKWMRYMSNHGKLYGPNLNPEDSTRTVFAIMVSSLHKKWSCISRLLPCASISAEKIFPIIRSCIIDIEHCGLSFVATDNYPLHVNLFKIFVATDNYPLHVNLFKIFSPNNELEIKVPHPFDEHSILFLTFDFVHILKIIRNNWLNQKILRKHSNIKISKILQLIIALILLKSIQLASKMYVFFITRKVKV